MTAEAAELVRLVTVMRYDDQQRDYIIAWECIIEAQQSVRGISWQSVDAENEVLARKILANADHAITVLAHAMRRNERKLLG